MLWASCQGLRHLLIISTLLLQADLCLEAHASQAFCPCNLPAAGHHQKGKMHTTMQICVSRDGKHVAVGLESGSLGLLAADKPHAYTPLVAPHSGRVLAVAVHPAL